MSAPDENGAPQEDHDLTIVGIGASAGGLSALKSFFATVPERPGFAFVVVVHLAPDQRSHLSELLQPHVRMPVRQVNETVPLERDHVYVIPPGSNLDTIDTHLRLSALEERRQERAPIDHFFRALARTHPGAAVGVVLTGTGSDGTLGLREIKERGGLSIVQDPNEAEFDGMPQSAIATGIVDLVLPVERIHEAIVQFATARPRLQVPREDEGLDPTTQRLLQKVFAQLRARTGRDFGRYKRSTILRRIARRMQLLRIEELKDYLERLREQPEESHVLADDLLITVTSFFRDTEVFRVLQAQVIPKLFEADRGEDDIRVWCVGCATGEEAYSLAILLLEESARHENPPPFQVFASDLHDTSLKRAREGLYPGDIGTDVSAERLGRFFVKENGGYRVRKEVRETVVFAPHNLFTDPPFSRLDLISCRNLLIYVQRDAQRDLIEIFHYALRTDGALLLGSSETVEGTELFRAENKKAALYRRRNVPAPEPRLPVFPLARQRPPGLQHGRAATVDPLPYPLLHQRIADAYAPASILVSPGDKVLHLSSQAGRFLVHPGGELTASIFKLVREELQLELRTVLHSARERSQVRRSAPIPVSVNGEPQAVVICVQPVMDPNHEGFALIVFEERESTDRSPATRAARGSRPRPGAASAREATLREELDLTRQRLQATIEEYETSQEEMRASNEEMQSTNEELRSTMEELETSKEELQSMNEELQTVNQENRHKVEELAQLTGDLQNLLVATDIATLFLDRELRIMRFTPKVSELFNVRVTDRSRPITDLTGRLGYPELPDDSERVLGTLVPIQREVEDEQGRWYLTRVMPYRSPVDRIEGVVITFVEITQRKLAERELTRARDHAELILDALPEPVLVLASDLRVRTANSAFYRHFGLDPAQAVGRDIVDIGAGEWHVEELLALLERLRHPGATSINDFEVTHHFGDRGQMVLLVNGRRLEQEQLIVLGFHDITARQAAIGDLRVSQQRLAHMINTEGIGVLVFDESGTITDANDAFLDMLGNTRRDVTEGRLNWRSLTPPDYVDVTEEQHRRLQATGRIGPYEREYFRRDGTRLWVLSVGASLGDGSTVTYCIDISHLKQVETALRESERQLASELTAVTRLHDLVARLLVAPDLRTALNEVVAASIDIIGDEMGTVQIRDPETGRLELMAHRGMPPTSLEHLRHATDDDGTAWNRAIASGERVVVRDALADPAFSRHEEVARAAGYRALQSTPLISRSGEVLGVLSTYYPVPHEPADRKLRILDLCARQATEFIEHLRNRDEAAAASRRKDEFIAILAHELRNPLAVIRNGLHLLQLSREDTTAFGHTSTMMQRQTRQLTMLVDDLLDVSRITQGKLELRRRIVTIDSVVQDAVESSRSFIDEAGHEFHSTVPADPVYVDADPDRLAQTLSNLLHNASKFTPEGGRIELSVARTDGEAVLSVRDTGIGMAPTVRERVFDLFAQGDRPLQPGESGLGIGLTLVKSLVEMHGGTVFVESDGPNRGSTFTIRLPVVDDPSRRAARSERSGGDISAGTLGQRRILIVDDNKDAADMLSHLLVIHGHEVFVATDGAMAVDVAREERPGLILMDLGMPGVSGYEAARRIRDEDWGRDLAIVAMTGWGQEDDRRRTKEAGFDVHLVKPVDLRSLQDVLTRFGRPQD